MRASGIKPVWANEKDPFACATFRINHPEVRLIEKSIEHLGVFADKLEPVDVLTAGFPCQPFSVAGEKRGLNDSRGVLFLEIIRLLSEFGSQRPKIIILENVKHFRMHDGGRTFGRIKLELQKAGYWFGESNALVLNTLDYSSIPQNRERLFMVALSTAHFRSSQFKFPMPIKPRKLRPLFDFIDITERVDDYFYFQPGSQYYPLFADAISDGGGAAIYQLRRNYVRRNMTGTCFTLMANMGDGGHNQPVIRDIYGIRKLTPKECARLQGYEDGMFSFPEGLSLTQQYKQIGNSVTVPVVTKIVEGVLSILESSRSKSQPSWGS